MKYTAQRADAHTQDNQGYASHLEERIAFALERDGKEIHYETTTVQFKTNGQAAAPYPADFNVVEHGFLLECKGLLTLANIIRYAQILNQTGVDLRFVITSPKALIEGTNSLTNEAWLNKMGVKWAVNRLPPEWYGE